MSSSPGEFDPLRHLLALKRHEAPPPGYFSHFSDKVMARIETEGSSLRPSWWRRLWGGMDANPLMACSYGGAMVGLLLVGLGVLDSVEPDSAVTASAVANPWFRPAAAPESSVLVDPPIHTPIAQAESSTSITPVVSRSTVPDSLFDVNRLRTQPVSYSFR